jgi:PhnB protein
MTESPPEGFPQITPYLLYEDVDAAVDWLVQTFGFVERVRMAGPDGKANHAEVALGDGVVMMGNPGSGYQNPKHRGGATQLVYVYVDDVDTHYQASKKAGAHILQELADQFYGDRTYGAEDPEGHQWSFGQHVRDVSPEDMHP